MFASDPLALAANAAFRTKLALLALLALAAVIAAAFHWGPYRTAARWDRETPAPLFARITAAVSIGLWLGVILCGRSIAYV